MEHFDTSRQVQQNETPLQTSSYDEYNKRMNLLMNLQIINKYYISFNLQIWSIFWRFPTNTIKSIWRHLNQIAFKHSFMSVSTRFY